MSISFSGLASGLDTSSWVESLVALKKAKVTSLEEEKKEVQSLQETLTQIKSFFSSFRSMLEKVTDAKFGVASMDLFAQNLATSSNLDALTASATTEAEEATYNVLVDKLASETKANSNYSYMTTIIQTTTATVDSKLINLGVKAGNIGVTVNGVEHGINITENDTISTFIEKLNNIGVKASYNEGSGVFSIDVGENSIRDIDTTGIVNALHLKGVNEGYTSDSLKTSTTDTIFSAATETTKLSELGVKNGTVTIHANDKDYSFTIDQNTTLGGFIADLKNKNIEASLDKDGVFTITDADITNEGSTDIKNALGLTSTVYEKAQITGDLTHKTIVTQTTTATSGTLLKDLGTGVKIEDNQTVVVKNSNNETTTITVGTTTTLGQLIEKISNAGLYAALKSDGTVEIAGGTITGGTFDAEKALGLEKEPYTAIVTGKSLTETVEVHKIVTLQTKLVDDLKVKEGYLEVTDADGNKFYEKIYSGQTIADFMADMGNLGINTSLDEDTGVLTITGGAFKTLSDADVKALVANGTIRETQDRFKQGTNLLACLYGADTIATEQITVASTHSKTRALRHTVVNTIDATKTTTLGNLGLSGTGTAIFDVRGEKRTITVDKTMTIEGLMNALKNAGIASSWSEEHSKLLIENSTLTGGTSNLSDVLNLTTEVSGKYITSSELYSTDTVTIDATRATVLKDYGITNSMSEADRTVTIYNSDGTVAGSTVVTESTTIGNLLDFINSKNGISASLTDGYLRVDNGYIGNATLEATMGLKTSNKSSYVLGSVMTVTTTSAVSGNTTLENIFRTIGTLDKVSGGYTLNFNSQSISVSATTTLNELISKIAQNGGNASLDATGRLSIDGGTLTGTVAEALGMTTVTNTVSVSASGQTMLVKQTIYANRDTKLSDLGVTGDTTYVVHNSLGQATTTVTLANTTSLGAFLDGLKAHQIDGVIADGVIKLDSASGQYITGDLATKLGIATQTVTDIVNTTVYSTSAVQYTATGKADLDTKLGAILTIDATNNTLVVYNSLNTAKTTITVSATTTLDELFGTLAKQGIQAEVNDGVISFVSKEGNYVTGSIIDSFGMTTTTVRVTTTTGTSATSSKFTHTNNENAKITDKISDFISLENPDHKYLYIYKNGQTGHVGILEEHSINDDTTFEELFKLLDDFGIQGTMEDGVITLTSNTGCYATGWVIDDLGITAVTTVNTVTVGKTTTSTAAISYTVTRKVTEDDSVLGCTTLTVASTLTVCDKNDSVKATLTVGTTMTFGELFSVLSGYDIDGDIHDGVIKLTSVKGNIIKGDVATALGLQTTMVVTTKTVGACVSSSAQVTYTSTVAASGTTRLSNVIGSYIIDGTISEKEVTGNVIGISTAQDLVNLRKLLGDGDTFSGKTFVMTQDIDMSGISNWCNIGKSNSDFSGIFDGQGYTISNLDFSNNSSTRDTSLFGELSNATVKNVKLDNITAQNNRSDSMSKWCSAYFLAISATNSTISNITLSNASVNNLNCSLIGATNANCRIENCTVDIRWTSDDASKGHSWIVSGIVSTMGSDGVTTITGCKANLNAKGYIFLGAGIVGFQAQTDNLATWNISNCLVTGSIETDRVDFPDSTNTSICGIIGGYVDYLEGKPVKAVINVDHCVIKADLKADKGYVNYITGGVYGQEGVFINVNADGVIATGTKTLTGKGCTGWVTGGHKGELVEDPSLYSYYSKNTSTNLSDMKNFGFNSKIWDSSGILNNHSNEAYSITINNKTGGIVDVISLSNTATIEDLIYALEPYGSATLSSDGHLSFTGNDGNYITGTLANQLGIYVDMSTAGTTMVGKTLTSTAPLTYTEMYTSTTPATGTTALKDVLMASSNGVTPSNEDYQLGIMNPDTGSILLDTTLSATSTIDDLINVLTPYGEVSFKNGVLSFVGTDGCILTGNLVNGLGIKLQDVITTLGTGTTVVKEATLKTITAAASGSYETTVYGAATSQYSCKVITGTGLITGTTKIGNITNGMDAGVELYNALTKQLDFVTIGKDGTVNDLIEELELYGTARIKNGKLSFVANGAWQVNLNWLYDKESSAYYDIFDEGSVYDYECLEHTLVSEAFNQYETTRHVTTSSALGSILQYGDCSLTIRTNDGTSVTIEMNKTDTVSDLIDKLAEYGVSLSLDENTQKFTMTIPTNVDYIKSRILEDMYLYDTYSLKISSSVYCDKKALITRIATEDDRWDDLSYDYDFYNVISIKNIKTGSWKYYDIDITNTIGETFKELENLYGIKGMIDSEGHLIFDSTGDYKIAGGHHYFDIYLLKPGETAVVTTITQKTVPITTTTKVNTSSVMLGGGDGGGTYTATATSKVTYGQLVSSIPTDATKRMYTIIGKSGDRYVFTVQENTTIGDVFSNLAAFDISATITDGKITVEATGDYFVEFANELADVYKLKDNVGYMSKVYSKFNNTSSKSLQISTNATLTSNTTLGELLGKDQAITLAVNKAGTSLEDLGNVNVFTSDNTIYDVLIWLAGNGIAASVEGGCLYLNNNFYGYDSDSNTDRGYIHLTDEKYDEVFWTALNIAYDQSSFITTKTSTTLANTTSNTLVESQSSSLLTSTKLKDIGITTAQTATVVNNGVSSTLTFSIDSTIDDMISTLAGYGIAGSVNGGKLTLTGTKDGYISSMSDGLKTALNLSVGSGNSYNTTTITTGSNTLSNRQNHNVTYDAQATTKISQTSAGLGTITVNYQGHNYNVTVSGDKTIGDVMNELAGYGISGSLKDGVLKFQGTGDGYVTDWGSAFGLTGGSYSTSTVTIQTNKTSNDLTYTSSNVTLTSDTKISAINGYSGGNGSLIIHKTDGTFVTISVDATKTLGEFFTQLSQYGLVGRVDSSGKVSIDGIGNVYMQQATGGSNILTALNLSNVVTNVKTVTVNRTSDTLHHTVTVAASGTTQLGNLQLSNGSTITFTGNDADLVLSTTSDAGNRSVTLNFSKTQSIYDVISALAGYGIDARIDSNGRFSMSSSTLTDFSISGALGTFLMGTYNKNYGTDTTYNTSTNLLETTTVFMKDSDALSTFGVTGGNIIINQEGVKYTVNVDMTQIRTVGDFRNLLSQYGFNSYIDDHGRLNVEGIGNSTLEQITGGSNILDKFGLLDWTLGKITQNSDHLTDTEVITRRISMSDKLKDLTNSSGVNLGITAGQIYVYQDGTRSTLNIDVNDTLETLQAKLSQYGITVGISQNGQLYFDGNNDSYLTTNGISSSNASNILQKFGISGTWSTRYDSTSEKLDYTTTSNNVVTGSTKLKDLNGADGKNLGITTGAFYVYNSGVRTTEQIEEDMTVNDLMATLAKYGLVADIDENGSISVGAYNNTYLATSALAGDNSNIVSTLFAQWDFVNIYKSNHLDVPQDEIRSITRDTKLSDINEGTYQAGYITVVKDGVKTNISLTADDTVGTLMDELALYGFESVINDKGQLMIKNTGDSLLQNYSDATKASNALTLLGIDLNNWINTNTYESGTLDVTKTSTIDAKATRDTLLSQLGVTTGEYFIYNNGVKYTAMISSDETIGSFMDTLKSFGIETSLVEKDGGSVLTIVGKGDSYLKKSTSTTNSSNVVEQLFKNNKTSLEYSGKEETFKIETTFASATEDTLVSYFDEANNKKSEGDLTVVVNGQKNTIKITADDTFGSLLEKFRALGIEATMSNGQIMLQSGYDTLTITPDGTTSNLLTNIKLVYDDDLGGYSASNVTVKSTTTSIEEKTLSVANYANSNTKLSDLNISEGTLTIYRDGIKAQINIGENDTFTTLQSRISEKFNKDNDVIVTFEDGYLKIYSKSGKNIEVGATSDSSNFGAITGIASDGTGVAKSARELYCVIGDSKITANGLFRRGNVKAGTFTVGDAVFTITNDTKLSDLISQINTSDASNATAFWDNVEGKLVIKSRTTGAALVNIEAGTSNFTDIMGFTSSQWNGDGSLKTTKMNIDTQEIGDNAKIKINGTTYTSTSNNITSDVTRIKGLTINLKGLTKDSSVTLKVERDKETLANAVSSVVDSYNELMKNVDEAIASDGDLKNESTLKLIRNQLRNLMTSSDAGTTVFRNLDSIGIGTSSASGSNISTANSAIISLTFDKDKFLKAYEADQDAVKELIIGGANNKGIFTKVEDLVESTLKSVSGYFASTETSYTNKIRDLDKKITKANKEVDRYKARLEAKFQSMDMLIAQMQQQYSSFLTT